MTLTIKQITVWLNDVQGRPAAPHKVAKALDDCDVSGGSFAQVAHLQLALKRRFIRPRRRQISDAQHGALILAMKFSFGPENARAFPALNRLSIAVEMMARVLHPGLVNQKNTLLCGPASVIMCLAALQPEKYVEFCAELADTGRATSAGMPTIVARSDVREYEGPGSSESCKSADWIGCAPLVGAKRSDIASNTGSNGTSVFGWLKAFQFPKALLMDAFPVSLKLTEPSNLLPDDASTSGESMLRTMCDLSDSGWHLAVLGRGELANALQALDKAASIGREMASTGLDPSQLLQTSMQQALTNLNSENQGLVRVLWNTLTGQSSAHSFHVTYVSRITRVEGTSDVRVNCSNWGGDQRWVTLPYTAFANKLTGFVAVSN